jgi:restriction system protein
MARRTGFISVVNAIARDAARRQRQLEADQRRAIAFQKKVVRENERLSKLQDKEDKQRYLSGRLEEADELNAEVNERIDGLANILNHTLSIDDTINFDSLRITDEFTGVAFPQELLIEKVKPSKDSFLSKVKAPGFLESALGMKGRYTRELAAAEQQYETAMKSYVQYETDRKKRLRELIKQNEEAKQSFNQKKTQRNQEVDQFRNSYFDGDISAIISYCSMVLERSDYPDEFPRDFKIAYSPDSKEIVTDFELPDVSVIPPVSEYKYNKSKDNIDEKQRKSSETKELYQDIVASVALRCIHEIFESDQGNHITVAVFNGYVQTTDPATGNDIKPYLISLRTTKDLFNQINLAKVDKRVCLKNLGAQVSSQPQAMQAVRPVVDINMFDKRFVDQGDVLSELESRPNLMDLTPSEFEALVSNLFGKMGLETKLTRASRDGGVDAVAFDLRPVLGGKVVIQAKRYKNTVGVSAVRDLYGTMLNEGANKGILVATSSYGPDAYEFSKDKPIELIDGGGLLYLLEQVGVMAKIIMPVEG